MVVDRLSGREVNKDDWIDLIPYFGNGYKLGENIVHVQIERNTLNVNIPISPPVEGVDGWTKFPDNLAKYHQLGENGKGNEKFVNVDGREAVYTKYDVLVTDSLNGGTYNFVPYNDSNIITIIGTGIGHFFADMLPYYVMGNDWSDPTNTWERITATYNGNDPIWTQKPGCPNE